MPSPVPKGSGASTSATIRSAHVPAEAERAAPAPRGSARHGAAAIDEVAVGIRAAGLLRRVSPEEALDEARRLLRAIREPQEHPVVVDPEHDQRIDARRVRRRPGGIHRADDLAIIDQPQLAAIERRLAVLRRHDDHRVARIDRGGDTFELRVDEAERSLEHYPRRGAVVDVTTEPRHAGVTDEM